MKKFILLLLALAAVVVGVAYYLFGSHFHSLTPVEQQYIEAAYKEAQASIDTHADELEKWYLDHCNGATKKTADSLTGWGMKWLTIKTWGDKDKISKKAAEIINEELFSAKECEEAVVKVLGNVALDWMNIENELALQTECYELSSKAKAEQVETMKINYSEDNLRTQVIRSLQTEGVSLVVGEIAAQLAVQMAASAGILTTTAALSPETLGISIVVGVLVDIVVGWIMDPSGKVQSQLDEDIRQVAVAQKKILSDALLKALEKRRADWEKQISSPLHF